MNLLCAIPSYWPAFQFGGPIASVHSLNKALIKKGIDVTVYTTNVGLDREVSVNQEVDVDGVKVTYFGFTRFLEFMGQTGWQFSWPMTRALRKNLKTFDIIHIHSIWNYPTAIVAYYCRKYNKPYIIAPRGALYPYTAKKKSWKKLPYYHLIVKSVLKNASALHYTTKDEMEACHCFLGLKNQAIVIPNGIDFSEFNDLPSKVGLKRRYPILKDKKVILFLGRINWKKGLDILIKAYAQVTKARNDTHLLIAGSDDGDGYTEKVKNWIAEYGLNAQVTFTGLLTGKEKLAIYSGSDIFVLPSYSENFAMVVIEAMVCGLPVVISNKVGLYREVEKNKAGIIVETNPESLYNGIKLLLDNENLKSEIAENGRRLVKEYYDNDKIAEMMIKMYEEILIK